MAKNPRNIFILNLDTGYYTFLPANGNIFGDGSFNDRPDQIQWLPNNMIYYTEGKLLNVRSSSWVRREKERSPIFIS